jgi:hypothetical protein
LNPSDFIENPEVAALAILKTSLEVAHCALAATYPECEPVESRSEQEAFAISILHHSAALVAMIDEYCESVRRSWRLRNSRGKDVEF